MVFSRPSLLGDVVHLLNLVTQEIQFGVELGVVSHLGGNAEDGGGGG